MPDSKNIPAVIAKILDHHIILAGGTNDGVEKGMTVKVGSLPVYHPVSNELITSVPVAVFNVVGTGPEFSTAEFIYSNSKNLMAEALREGAEVEVVGERWGLIDNG